MIGLLGLTNSLIKYVGSKYYPQMIFRFRYVRHTGRPYLFPITFIPWSNSLRRSFTNISLGPMVGFINTTYCTAI